VKRQESPYNGRGICQYQQLNLQPGTPVETINEAYLKLRFETGREEDPERLGLLKDGYCWLKEQLQLRAYLAQEQELSTVPPAPQHHQEDTNLLSFQNRFSNALVFPLLSMAAIALNLVPLTRFLLRGINIWFHEFGHATIAWLSGRRAIPLPFGWTSFNHNRSPSVYFGILILLGLLFWAGWREKKRWPMVVATTTALLQFWMTWLVPSQTFDVLMAFGGIGGEFYLCAFLMVSYFFPLPACFRWDFYRFPVMLGAAFTFWHNLWFWHQVDRDQAVIPWGSLWGGSSDSGGDMNQLVASGWSSQQIIDTYNMLGGCCLVAIIGIYIYFTLKDNRIGFSALRSRTRR